MDNQAGVSHEQGNGVACGNEQDADGGRESGAKQPQEDWPERCRQRGVAAKAGEVDIPDADAPAHKGQFGEADYCTGDAKKRGPLPGEIRRFFTQQQDGEKERGAGQQHGTVAEERDKRPAHYFCTPE